MEFTARILFGAIISFAYIALTNHYFWKLDVWDSTHRAWLYSIYATKGLSTSFTLSNLTVVPVFIWGLWIAPTVLGHLPFLIRLPIGFLEQFSRIIWRTISALSRAILIFVMANRYGPSGVELEFRRQGRNYPMRDLDLEEIKPLSVPLIDHGPAPKAPEYASSTKQPDSAPKACIIPGNTIGNLPHLHFLAAHFHSVKLARREGFDDLIICFGEATVAVATISDHDSRTWKAIDCRSSCQRLNQWLSDEEAPFGEIIPLVIVESEFGRDVFSISLHSDDNGLPDLRTDDLKAYEGRLRPPGPLILEILTDRLSLTDAFLMPEGGNE